VGKIIGVESSASGVFFSTKQVTGLVQSVRGKNVAS
jgi:hypothetical protein